MTVTAQSVDYGAFMRNSMSAIADLLQSIERDIQESRQLIQPKSMDERTLTQLVSSLEEDNNILLVRTDVILRTVVFSLQFHNVLCCILFNNHCVLCLGKSALVGTRTVQHTNTLRVIQR